MIEEAGGACRAYKVARKTLCELITAKRSRRKSVRGSIAANGLLDKVAQAA